MEDYRVETDYFCCVISAEKERIIKAAPIMGWTVGRTLPFVKKWVENKKGKIELLCQPQTECLDLTDL